MNYTILSNLRKKKLKKLPSLYDLLVGSCLYRHTKFKASFLRKPRLFVPNYKQQRMTQMIKLKKAQISLQQTKLSEFTQPYIKCTKHNGTIIFILHCRNISHAQIRVLIPE